MSYNFNVLIFLYVKTSNILTDFVFPRLPVIL
jgi:hypothetical protein